MNIYDYAMEMEKDGEVFYRELAVRTANKGLKTILTMLADAEVQHYNLFQNLKTHENILVAETTILDDVKNIFIKMKEEGQFTTDVTQVELYKEAQDLETKTRSFYLEKSDEVGSPRKEIFLKVAEEEKRHFFILDRIIDFVNRPTYWLENPEWYHLEPY